MAYTKKADAIDTNLLLFGLCRGGLLWLSVSLCFRRLGGSSSLLLRSSLSLGLGGGLRRLSDSSLLLGSLLLLLNNLLSIRVGVLNRVRILVSTKRH